MTQDQKHSVGVNRGGGYWCASCGDLCGPCEHFPALLRSAPDMLKALEAVAATFCERKEDLQAEKNSIRHSWVMVNDAIRVAKGDSK